MQRADGNFQQEGADEQKLEAPLLIDQGSEASML